MMDSEFPSTTGLKPVVSRLPQPASKPSQTPMKLNMPLQDISNNVATSTMAPPSQNISVAMLKKRKTPPTDLDTEPKRQTLVEKAGQTVKRQPAKRNVTLTMAQPKRPPNATTRPAIQQEVINCVQVSSIETRTVPANSGPKSSRPKWDTKGRLEDMTKWAQETQERLVIKQSELGILEKLISTERTRVQELEDSRAMLMAEKAELSSTSDHQKKKIDELKNELVAKQQEHKNEVKVLNQRHKDEIDELCKSHHQQVESMAKSHKCAINEVEKTLKAQMEEQKISMSSQIQELRTLTALEKQKLDQEFSGKERDLTCLREENNALINEANRQRCRITSLENAFQEQSSSYISLEANGRILRTQLETLELSLKTANEEVSNLKVKLSAISTEKEEAFRKLREEETVRRKLHNQIQELKGNIRVFCRVRPLLQFEKEEDKAADILFPDSHQEGKEIELIGPTTESSLGNVTTKNYPFSFDKVFGPESQNTKIFEEISQLVQSALDGYNVCIFAYGQTGSGKTFTMSSLDGMIPLAVHQIYNTASTLKEKGWEYSMEGQFLEIYNETINDLLGKAEEFDKKKHEIRHEPKDCRTTITDLTSVLLDNPERLTSLLEQANKNRTVAATKANERSSRSHSVFILKLVGKNELTKERSEGTLNLVDLAGSERLNYSQSTGERLKETQAINKSLSCLGDVISALGNGKENGHIPYRNSKLTYLLQYSLGGNSKTLMFVNISPKLAHLSESLCSLRFARLVNNTQIGTAKKIHKAIV